MLVQPFKLARVGGGTAICGLPFDSPPFSVKQHSLWLQPGIPKANGRKPKSCLCQVFNSKSATFAKLTKFARHACSHF